MTVYNGKLYVGGYYNDTTSDFRNQYVAKYNSNTNSFESILNGLEQKSYNDSNRILAMIHFEEEDDNIALILGLVLGLGLGLPLLVYFYLKMKK